MNLTSSLIRGRYYAAVNVQNDTLPQMAHPTYAIDLIWHTHMMHPIEYRSDTQRLLGTYATTLSLAVPAALTNNCIAMA
jgi:hypothetical protein